MADFYSKTAQDVATYVKRQFGDESGVQITDDDIIQWLNIAQMDLAQDNEFSKKIGTTNLVGDQAEYSFPDYDILYTQTIYVGSKIIKFLTYQEFQEYIQKKEGYDAARSAVPRVWTEWGGTFTFWPTPSEDVEGAVKVYFISKPSEVNTLQDALGVPDRLFSVLIKMVMVHAYNLDEQFDAANLQDQRVSNELGKMAFMPDKSSINEYHSMTILEPDEYGW